MKKKSASDKKKLANKSVEFRKRFRLTDAQYLERLIQISEKAATTDSESLNDLFMAQANRLRKELKELKK